MDINEIELKINDSLIFRRFERIDWKQIASVNLDQLKNQSNLNWSTIEKNIGNILCCHLQSEFDTSCLDANLCKLFQLAQVSIEYLLQIRQQSLTEVKTLQEKFRDSEMKLNASMKLKEETEKKYKELKKDSKKSNHHQQYYRCPSCPKTFLNGEFLRGHWQRRHAHLFTATQDGEKVPHDENQIANSIIAKMDRSNTSLQEFVAHEIEKIRQEFEKGSKLESTRISESSEGSNIAEQPKTRSVGTQVSIVYHSIAICTDNIQSSSMATNTEDVVSIRPSDRQCIVESCSNDSSEDDNSDLQLIEAPVDRGVAQIDAKLMDRFKMSIRNALKDRMRMLGIDENHIYSTNKTKRILQHIRSLSARNAEFQKWRQHFQVLLQKRLNHPNERVSPLVRKRLFPLTYSKAEKRKEESGEKKPEATKKVRPPVPTPRGQSEQSSSFMARNGEASNVSHSSQHEIRKKLVKSGDNVSNPQVNHHLENKSKEMSISTPINANKSSEDESGDSSFSLSSLDDILTELKRPKRNNGNTKSVQWKNPVEHSVSIENSWDS